MARGFKAVDRDQGFLLAPDMREWLPGDHLVWFVIEAVGLLDTTRLRQVYRLGGVGREAFDPDMLLGLLVYAYCQGIRSSRAIERACHTDVAMRVLCAQRVPDHTVVARFRARHEAVLAGLFEQVLVLCARAGLGRVGIVAVDGTKIAADASPLTNRRRDWLTKQVADMFTEAKELDEREDAQERDHGGPPDRLGPEWRDRSGRRERLKRALEELAGVEEERTRLVRQAQARADRVRAGAEAALQDRQARLGEPPKRTGAPLRTDRLPVRVTRRQQAAERAQARADRVGQEVAALPPAQINTTDPQSRVMKTRQGWVQGYNCQIAASEDGLILAAAASQAPIDMHQFAQATTDAVASVALISQTGEARQIGLILADAGYFSEENLTLKGPDRLIAAGKRRSISGDDPVTGRLRPPSTNNKPACDAMVELLRKPDQAELYKRRAAIVEPIHAHLKDRRGLRRFARRGLTAANSELKFAALVTNLLRWYTTSWQPAHA